MTFRFQYTNHKGETEVRTVRPIRMEPIDNPALSGNPHLAGYPGGWFLVAFDPSRNAERSFRISYDRMKPVYNDGKLEAMIIGDPIVDTAQVKDAVQGLAQHADSQAAKLVREFAGFLSTSEKVVMAGAQYPIYDMQERVNEFFKAKGMTAEMFKLPDQPDSVVKNPE